MSTSQTTTVAKAVSNLLGRLFGIEAVTGTVGDAVDVWAAYRSRDTAGEYLSKASKDLLSTALMADLQHECPGLDEGDIMSACHAVRDVIDVASDDDKFVSILTNPGDFARRVSETRDWKQKLVLMSDSGAHASRVLLDRSCLEVALQIQRNPDFANRALRITLNYLQTASGDVAATLQKGEADKYKIKKDFYIFTKYYNSIIIRLLDEVRVYGFDVDPLPQTYRFSNTFVAPTLLLVRDMGAPIKRTAQEALDESDFLTILGEPGHGKTSLAKWIIMEQARHNLLCNDTSDMLVPFFVELGSNSENLSVHDLGEPYIGALPMDRPDGWASDLVQAGKALIVVDGLDQIGAPQRSRVLVWLQELNEKYARRGLKIVLTLRSSLVSHDQSPITGSLYHLHPVADVTFLGQLVSRWHSAATHSVDRNRSVSALELICQIEEDVVLRILAQNPMVCIAVCSVMQGRLLRLNLPELLDDLLAMFLARRDMERNHSLAILGLNQSRSLVQALANQCFRAGNFQQTRSAVRKLVSQFAAQPGNENLQDYREGEILDSLIERTGILKSLANGDVAFSTPVISEYLAGCFYSSNDFENELVASTSLDQWMEVMRWCLLKLPPRRRNNSAGALLELLPYQDRTQAIAILAALKCVSLVCELDISLSETINKSFDEYVDPSDPENYSLFVSIGDAGVDSIGKSIERESLPEARRLLIGLLIDTPGTRALELLSGLPVADIILYRNMILSGWRGRNIESYAKALFSKPLKPGESFLVVIRNERQLSSTVFIHETFDLVFELDDGVFDWDSIRKLDRRVRRATLRNFGSEDLRSFLSRFRFIDSLVIINSATLPPLDLVFHTKSLRITSAKDTECQIAIGFLACFAELEKLSIGGDVRLVGSAVLRDFPRLSVLELCDADFLDIAVFSPLVIKTLILRDWPYVDLTRIAPLTSVEELMIFHSPLLEDISAVVNLDLLNVLYIIGCPNFEGVVSMDARMDINDATFDSGYPSAYVPDTPFGVDNESIYGIADVDDKVEDAIWWCNQQDETIESEKVRSRDSFDDIPIGRLAVDDVSETDFERSPLYGGSRAEEHRVADLSRDAELFSTTFKKIAAICADSSAQNAGRAAELRDLAEHIAVIFDEFVENPILTLPYPAELDEFASKARAAPAGLPSAIRSVLDSTGDSGVRAWASVHV
ncbi:NACHT domain-containing protein [Arthrobacter sp. Sr33]